MKKAYNKLPKNTPLQKAQLRGTRLSTRPLARRYVYMRPLLILISAMIFQTSVLAEEKCELSDEFLKARKEALIKSEEIHLSYNDCRNFTHGAAYWRAVASCIDDSLGDRCQHLVAEGDYPREEVDVSHCEKFKVSENKQNQYFEGLLERTGVPKCKT